MSAALLRLLAPVWQALLAIGVAASALLWARQSGKTAARSEAQAQTLQNVEVRNEVDRTVARDPAPAERLRERWSRD